MSDSPLTASLEAIDRYVDARSKYPDVDVLRARLRAMLRAYDIKWTNDVYQYKVLGVEYELYGPLVNLETGKRSNYQIGGKIDVHLQETSGRKQTLILDHKGLTFAFDEDDIQHLLIDNQPHVYAYLAGVNGMEVQGAIWDICAKTGQRPLKKNKRNKVDESLDDFEERVFQSYLENLDKHFSRPRIPILKYSIAESIHNLYEWTKEMDTCEKTKVFLPNPDFCWDHNRMCPYLGLCTGRSSEDDGSWTRREKVHAELDIPESIEPVKVVTNSRLRLYRGCRLRHHRQYVQCLTKKDRVEEDVLVFGSGLHFGLEARFKAIQKIQWRN